MVPPFLPCWLYAGTMTHWFFFPSFLSFWRADVTIIIMDDQRLYISNWADTILGDPEAAQYVGGTGVHWYFWFSSRLQEHN